MTAASPPAEIAGRVVPLDAWPRTDTVVVYDLEYTAWEGSQDRDWSGAGEVREIVEIGAIRLDAADGFRERDSFRQLVRPVLNPVLSTYFTRLTGISNAAVRAEGVGFVEAVRRLCAFVGPSAPLLSHGGDYLVLLENFALWRRPWPFAPGRCGDLRPGIAGFLGVPVGRVVSGELPAALGLASDGQVHSALDDARAVAAAMRSLRARGVA